MNMRPSKAVLLGLFALLILVPLGCGGGGGGGGDGGGGAVGAATSLKQISTPLGAQGNLGDLSDPTLSYVNLLYNLSDPEYSQVDIKIEFGVDWDENGIVAGDEWRDATSVVGLGDGKTNLRTAPGKGKRQLFVWDSTADIGSNRFVTVDYRWDTSGRLVTNEAGAPTYETHPGCRLKVTILDDGGAVSQTSPFAISNNTLPVLAPDLRVEGLSESVSIYYKPVDANGDTVSIAVDYSTDGGTNWLPATPTAGTAITGIPTQPTVAAAVEQMFVWDSVADVGTVRAGSVLVRVKPFDTEHEHGETQVLPAPFVVENWEIFSNAGAVMGTPRVDHRATTLLNGDVLVTGGRATPGGAAMDSAEVFYPSLGPTTTGTIADTNGMMTTARADHVAVRLYDGRILVVGGQGASGLLASAELYDPATGMFTATGSMGTSGTARRGAAAALLLSGEVLVAGGVGTTGAPLKTTEIYDPATGTWTDGPDMDTARTGAEAVVLGAGRVLIPGGLDGASEALATAELYDPETGSFLATVDLDEARYGHSVTRMRDGRVLLAGGMASPPKFTLESFDPETDSFAAATAELTTARDGHSAAELGDGRILLFGGMDVAMNVLATAERWNPVADAMTEPKGELQNRRSGAAVATLQNGRPAIFGGYSSATMASSAIEVYTPAGGSNTLPVVDVWSPGEPLFKPPNTTSEFAQFGVRINYVLMDAEGDAVRIRALYSVDGGSTWSPCTAQDSVASGDTNDGTEGLAASAGGVQHLYIWNAANDLGTMDDDIATARVRIIPYGAEEGTQDETANFTLIKQAPVVVIMTTPTGSQFGPIDFDFTLYDKEGDEAYLQYPDGSSAIQWAVDLNDDGQILITDGETWKAATPVSGSIDHTTGLATLSGGNPVAHTFTWDSVRDIGAPVAGRSDIVFRIWGMDADQGINDTVHHFQIITDPDGLQLVTWHPQGQTERDPDQTYGGSIELDRPVVFNFNMPILQSSATSESIVIYVGSQRIEGYCEASGNSVIFHPQMQGLPTRSDALAPGTTYSFRIPAYDPANHGDPVLKTTYGDGDYNDYVFVNELALTSAFRTMSSYSYVSDSVAPTWVSFDTPGPAATNVSVGSTIVMTFDEPIDPATVTHDGIQVFATDGTNYGRVPGTFTVVNYPGPAGVDKSVITFTPTDDLPAGVGFEVRINSGVLDDFRGNSAPAAPSQTFLSEGGQDVKWSKNESFDNTVNVQADKTTAYWSTQTPGKLTGYTEAGSGSDGAKTVSGIQTLTGTSGAGGNVWEFSSLTVNSGASLRFNTSKCDADKKMPVLLVTGPVRIYGTIDVSGGNGISSSTSTYTMTYSSSLLHAGGAGGPNGADGARVYKNSSYVSTYTGVNGTNGSGLGGGKGGKPYTTGGNYYNGYTTGGAGGGGGSYASIGKPGLDRIYQSSATAQYKLTGGLPGATYGSNDLLNDGLQGGSGGGSGSLMYYNNSSTFMVDSGSGGGGGGSLKIFTFGPLTIYSTGKIDASGGNGGAGMMRNTGGGGGSGGDVLLASTASVSISGTIDVSGGLGGWNRYTGTLYYVGGAGGDGGDGRVQIASPSGAGLARILGPYSRGTNGSITDGGLQAGQDGPFKPTKDTVFPTVGSKTTWYFTEIDVPAGVTVTFDPKFTKPVRWLARDGINIAGTIRMSGGSGNPNAQVVGYNTTWPSTHFTAGAAGSPGGYAGGKGGNGTNRTTAQNGAGTMRGEGGDHGTYYTVVGPGAGGSHGTRGQDGNSYSYSSTYQAKAGKASTATLVNPAALTHSNLKGGSGGGGAGGYNSSYSYYHGTAPMSGGGGAGALTLETPEKFTLTGVIEARGGDGGAKGGGQHYYYQYYYATGAGGGAGGGILLRAGEFDIVYGMVDASGGKRSKYCFSSWEKYTSLSMWVAGGHGGDGVIKFEGKSSLPAVSNVTVKLGSGRRSYNGYTPYNNSSSQSVLDTVGRGHVSGGAIASSDMGVSKWFDGGSVWTKYTKLTASFSPGGAATPYIEVANSNPATGEVDESVIYRYIAADVSSDKANGRRWWRFVWKLYPTVPSPAVDEGTVEGVYEAK
jgi:Bacterial Ig-like domain/Kelch motif/Galactose oxidase, central domain